MAIADKDNVTKRADVPRALTREEADQNFQELKNTIEDLAQHESSGDPHPQYQLRTKDNLDSNRDPLPTDDSSLDYQPRSLWFNNTTREVYRCISSEIGSAVWAKTTLTLDELGSAATADVDEINETAKNNAIRFAIALG